MSERIALPCIPAPKEGGLWLHRSDFYLMSQGRRGKGSHLCSSYFCTFCSVFLARTSRYLFTRKTKKKPSSLPFKSPPINGAEKNRARSRARKGWVGWSRVEFCRVLFGLQFLVAVLRSACSTRISCSSSNISSRKKGWWRMCRWRLSVGTMKKNCQLLFSPFSKRKKNLFPILMRDVWGGICWVLSCLGKGCECSFESFSYLRLLVHHVFYLLSRYECANFLFSFFPAFRPLPRFFSSSSVGFQQS